MVSFTNAASTLLFLGSFALANASFEPIAGYDPGSQVTDHNAIDLDQAAMEAQLVLGTQQSFDNAYRIYSEGGHSKVVAAVKLTFPLLKDIPKGTTMIGLTEKGTQVAGKAYDDYPMGSTTLSVQYVTSNSQQNYNQCQVGALVNPNTEGCFAASGTFNVDGMDDFSYNYDVLTNNSAKRTIAGFSTSAQKKMYECEKCPYKMYQMYFDYYGTYDYANQIVIAAFNGTRTNFRNFNNDFGVYSYAGREQIIKKTSAYMVILMYAIREMEDALDDCKESCVIESCNDDPVHAWDEAVAFYTGSLQGWDGSGAGKLTYNLAEKRCQNFKTCGENADSTSGTANINLQIFEEFSIGKAKIAQGRCGSTRAQKEAIETMMIVPLVQGALRYTWKTANEPYNEVFEAERVAFALAVLPIVASCDKIAAKKIADYVDVGPKDNIDYPSVKAAFESTYECLGLKPESIGGLWDGPRNTYLEGAEPMNFSAGSSISTLVAAGVTGVASLFMLL